MISLSSSSNCSALHPQVFQHSSFRKCSNSLTLALKSLTWVELKYLIIEIYVDSQSEPYSRFFTYTIFVILRSSSNICGKIFGDTGAPSHRLLWLEPTQTDIPCYKTAISWNSRNSLRAKSFWLRPYSWNALFYRGISLKRELFLWVLNGLVWVLFPWNCKVILIPPTEIVLKGAA